MQRRRFIQAVTVGLVALSTPKIVDNGLEMIASVQAEEKAPISETEFERLMKYDTVDDILKEYGIGSVDDSSYQRKVYDSGKHVMVVFYNNRSQGSKGLSVLAGELSEQFGSQFEVLGYKMSESSDQTPVDVFNHVRKTYSFRTTPAILFYQNKGTNVERNESIEGGIVSFRLIPKNIKIIGNYFKTHFFK